MPIVQPDGVFAGDEPRVMRRATLIVAVAALREGFAPLFPPAPRVLLLTLAAIAMTAAAFRDYGRVAAAATLVAFTSSAVVLLGGLSAARPAAGSLPTAGVLWWWPLAVGRRAVGRRRAGANAIGAVRAARTQSLTDTSTFPTLDGSDAHRARI